MSGPDRERVLVFGAGGHGKVVAEALAAAGCEPLGFLDDAPDKLGVMVLGLEVLGGASWLESVAPERALAVALGIGDARLRAGAASRVRELGRRVASVVHPGAIVSRSARIDAGAVVFAGAVVQAEAWIGEGAIVNTGAVVEHDCEVGAFAHVSPRAVLGGGARLGPGAQLGLGAVVLPGVAVGARTLVGAGAVVTRDLGEDLVAVGVPARVVRRRDQGA